MRLTVLVINWHSGGDLPHVYTGGGKRARVMVDGLVRRGHEVHVVDVAPSVVRGLRGIRSVREIRAWMRPALISASPLEQAMAAMYATARLSGIARQLVKRGRPDIIYVPSAELLPALFAGWAARSMGVPLVACAQTIVGWGSRPRYGAVQRLLRRLLSQAAATVVVSPSVARTLEHEGFCGRVVVGLNGVDRAPRLALGSRSRRLLYLSRIIPLKGAYDAVRAFAAAREKAPNAILEVRGPGAAQEYERIRILGRDLGLAETLRVGGPIPTDEEKWRLLADSAGFVAPSYMEHFGLAVREALSAGLPTAVYALPPFDDLADHPGLIQVPLGDHEDLCRALVTMLQLPPEARRHLAEASARHPVGATWEQAVEREQQILVAAAQAKAIPSVVSAAPS